MGNCVHIIRERCFGESTGGTHAISSLSQIPLSGANSIVGRAVVVHELEDDLGKGDHSQPGTQVRRKLVPLFSVLLDAQGFRFYPVTRQYRSRAVTSDRFFRARPQRPPATLALASPAVLWA